MFAQGKIPYNKKGTKNSLIYFRIISVGGDGMFSEILNGILMREEVQPSCSTVFNPQKPNIKLGIIPAGLSLYLFE